MSKIKIALIQENFIVGDLQGNSEIIEKSYQKAVKDGANLVIFPELAITGYPPEDLLLRPDFIRQTKQKLHELAKLTLQDECAILVGAPYLSELGQKKLRNGVFLLEGGQVGPVADKYVIPNYNVFNEARYFETGQCLQTVQIAGYNFAILVCEDMWDAKNSALLGGRQVDGVIVINASPFEVQKHQQRLECAQKFTDFLDKPLIYVNHIGAQDDIIFDGSSFALNGSGEYIARLKSFEKDYALLEFEDEIELLRGENEKFAQDQYQDIYNALKLGLGDYLAKNNFKKVLIGMSGGIDSALTAVLAADVLGPENVTLVALPSRYNSDQSLIDAQECAQNLGIELKNISIEPVFSQMLKVLESEFAGLKPDVAEENLQSRIRGNLLMAMSNKFGSLLLATGNKSEMSVGYATLYGDMCGAFAPLKDIYKMDVFALAKWRNGQGEVIPQNIIDKPPTAELREDQKDSDSLPEYEILDAILRNLIEECKSSQEIAQELNLELELVQKIANLLKKSEYKRRQAPIGAKISSKAFGKNRLYPITNNFNF